MKECLVYEDSVRFARTGYGLLALAGMLLGNFWIILGVAVLMITGAVSSMKWNLFYQLHLLLFPKNKFLRPTKDLREICFSCYLGASFLFLAFFLFYFCQLTTFAWVLVGMVVFLSLLAGVGGFCVGSLLYVLFKKVFKKILGWKKQLK